MRTGDACPELEKGQAILIVLLVMAVGLTIVLSVVGSSTSDIRISSNESESLRAFSAAESGVEKALVSNSASSGTVGNANFTANVSSFGQGDKSFNYPNTIVNGDIGELWFVNHGTGSSYVCNSGSPCFTGKTVRVCWGKPGTASNAATTPAIDLTVYYLNTPGDYSTARVAKATYDPNASRLASDSFAASDPGSCTIGSTSYAFSKLVDLSVIGVPVGSYSIQNGLQLLSARMLFNSNQEQSLGFDVNFAGNSTLPAQGQQVDSTGSLNTATRRIQVTSPYAGIPAILDTVIYSPSGIAQ